MNLNHFEAMATLDKLRVPARPRTDLADVDVSVHPPFTDIRSVQTFLESEKADIALGAQNCHWEDEGRVHRRGVARRSWPSSTCAT